jgi:hypothetical protein
MAASTAGALKAFLEAQGLGISVYRDQAPEGPTFPYVTVHEAISVSPEPAFNSNDDAEGHVIEQVQVSIWQRSRHPDTLAKTESYTLPDAICLALTGARLTAMPTYGGHVRVQGRTRLPEDEGTIIHDAVTIEVRRTLARRP